MSRFLASAGLLCFLWACAAEQPAVVQPNPTHTAEIERLRKELQEKERQFDLQSAYAEDATKTIVELHEHLAKAEALEDTLGLPPIGTGDEAPTSISATRKDQLLAGVQRLQLALEAQAKLLADFRQREGQYTVKVAQLEQAIASYEQQLTENRRELASVRTQIQEMRIEVQELRRDNEEKAHELAAKQRTLEEREAELRALQHESRKAFYTARPLQDLLASRVVLQKRVMLRRVRTLAPELSHENFERIDIDTRREFILTAPLKRVEIISVHPPESYELASRSDGQTQLTITDVDEFWKLRYLVIALR